jgi:hypothetical protein
MRLNINRIFLIQLLYLSLAGITALQKIIPFEIPKWFISKFEKTIGIIPFGIEISFIIITLLESAIALLILISILKKEYLLEVNKSYMKLAMEISMILFLILFFGSFLTMSYDNGALDFIYFIGTMYLYDHFIIKNKEKQIKIQP